MPVSQPAIPSIVQILKQIYRDGRRMSCPRSIWNVLPCRRSSFVVRSLGGGHWIVWGMIKLLFQRIVPSAVGYILKSRPCAIPALRLVRNLFSPSQFLLYPCPLLPNPTTLVRHVWTFYLRAKKQIPAQDENVSTDGNPCCWAGDDGRIKQKMDGSSLDILPRIWSRIISPDMSTRRNRIGFIPPILFT